MKDLEQKEATDLLIAQAQSGSREAYEKLLFRYRPLIDSLVSGFISSDMSMQDIEDLAEEARHIFLASITSYDLSRDGVEFGLYAKICLKNGLISELRRQMYRHRLGVVSLTSDDLETGESGYGSDDPAKELVEEEDFRQLYRKVRACLSQFENSVWWMYVSGVSAPDIAKSLGKDEKSVHNAIYRIRVKLKQLLERGES